MASLSDLIATQSRDEIKTKILQVFRLGGFPVSSWGPFAVVRYLVESLADNLFDWSKLLTDIVRGGFLDLAEGDWLTLLAKSLFNEDRFAAVATRGKVRLFDTASSGPHTILAGTQWLATAGALRRYKNLADATLPLGGFVDIEVEAESPGEAWNVTSDTITTIVTGLLGLGITLTNPAGTSGSWITQQGVEAETDVQLRQRCRDKWATLGSGSNEEAYRYFCTSSSQEVTRVRIDSNPSTGTVTCVVAGPSDAVTPTALALVQATVERKRPLTVAVTVRNASQKLIPIAATLYLLPGYTSTGVLDAARDAVNAYARTTGIGDTLYLSQLIRALQDVVGVKHVAPLLSPVGDVDLLTYEVFVPSFVLATQ